MTFSSEFVFENKTKNVHDDEFVTEYMTPQDLSDSGYESVERDSTSWAGAMPASQGLYNAEYEKAVSYTHLTLPTKRIV